MWKVRRWPSKITVIKLRKIKIPAVTKMPDARVSTGAAGRNTNQRSVWFLRAVKQKELEVSNYPGIKYLSLHFTAVNIVNSKTAADPLCTGGLRNLVSTRALGRAVSSGRKDIPSS